MPPSMSLQDLVGSGRNHRSPYPNRLCSRVLSHTLQCSWATHRARGKCGSNLLSNKLCNAALPLSRSRKGNPSWQQVLVRFNRPTMQPTNSWDEGGAATKRSASRRSIRIGPWMIQGVQPGVTTFLLWSIPVQLFCATAHVVSVVCPSGHFWQLGHGVAWVPWGLYQPLGQA